MKPEKKDMIPISKYMHEVYSREKEKHYKLKNKQYQLAVNLPW